MSTVAEIKRAVSRLPGNEKLELSRWLRSVADDHLSDEALMEIAAEGARALDEREASHAERKAR